MDTIVYFGSRLDDLRLDALEGARRGDDGAIQYVTRGRAGLALSRRVVATDDLPRALDLLRRAPVDALVVDARADAQAALRLLELVFPAGRMGAPLLRKRARAGRRGRDRDRLRPRGARDRRRAPDPSGPELAARLDAMLGPAATARWRSAWPAAASRAALRARGAPRARRLHGGSIRGRPRSLLRHQRGRHPRALLANGVGPDEILRALDGGATASIRSGAGTSSSRTSASPPRGWPCRARAGAWRRGPRGALSSLLRAVPTAAFSGRRLTAWLERQLERPGMSNRFGELRRPLYVGATDQDTSEAVLFGDEGHAHVPVHRAVRASCALVPFYPPVLRRRALVRRRRVLAHHEHAGGRAARRHARHPRRSARPGARGRARLACARAAASTAPRRGSGAHQRPLRQGGRRHRGDAPERRLPPLPARGRGDAHPPGSPMKYFYRREVEEIAFEHTLAKIRESHVQLARDLALHGVTLRHPDRIGERTLRAPHPRFAPDAIGIG
ncbi:MAG: hypothetical protein M5U28_27235 [Sandaracinaceae bacterium]|nr:hypothetical protein [Sandaracinaceae bacterium]